MIVLVPAYEPDGRLTALVAELARSAPRARVVVVDDGSGPAYAPVLDDVAALGATVVVDAADGGAVNHGKGHALRLGFRHLLEGAGRDAQEVVVCADCDGQHTVRDVLRVAERAGAAGAGAAGGMVLGGRRFTGRVPLRSRLGNAVARGAFRLVTGLPLHDTQTGLRAYPLAMLPWLLSVPGERFEYELAVLLRARGAGHAVVELPVETVYLEQNASSHFRPVVDSLRVLAPVLRFAATGSASFALELALLVLLQSWTGSLLLALVGARVVSGSANFLANKLVVFRATDRRHTRREALRYACLAVVLVAAGYVLLRGFAAMGAPVLPAKVLTDLVLFLVGWSVQRRLVFARPSGTGRAPGAGTTPASRRSGARTSG
ncbi:glycosyltransferase involved in cell wall biosynthesis [Cellulomonas sp. PhB143]|nr:glycosyltransferase involved in cell wall biosynthesis [Cellulomonas sp. PhB143]